MWIVGFAAENEIFRGKKYAAYGCACATQCLFTQHKLFGINLAQTQTHTYKQHAADIHKPNGSWKGRTWIRFDSRQNAAGLENVPQSAYWLRNACFPLTSSYGAGCATDTRYIACGHTLRRRLSLQCSRRWPLGSCISAAAPPAAFEANGMASFVYSRFGRKTHWHTYL